MLKLALVCAAESNSSNQRILDSTLEYLNTVDSKIYLILIIGWAKVDKKNISEHDKIYELHRLLKKQKYTPFIL
jgi:hypothetical protein